MEEEEDSSSTCLLRMSTKMESKKRINQKSMSRKISLKITSGKITRTRRRQRKKNRGRRSITTPCIIVQVQSAILQIAYQTPPSVTSIPESSFPKYYNKFKTSKSQTDTKTPSSNQLNCKIIHSLQICPTS